mmetsp:Transcript_62945/g.205467  ORF Transcript_62945/g.205467 Transcript_62945/m.205467 type:complete len:260 (+) Transcript_62945:528-1307(+)
MEITQPANSWRTEGRLSSKMPLASSTVFTTQPSWPIVARISPPDFAINRATPAAPSSTAAMIAGSMSTRTMRFDSSMPGISAGRGHSPAGAFSSASLGSSCARTMGAATSTLAAACRASSSATVPGNAIAPRSTSRAARASSVAGGGTGAQDDEDGVGKSMGSGMAGASFRGNSSMSSALAFHHASEGNSTDGIVLAVAAVAGCFCSCSAAGNCDMPPTAACAILPRPEATQSARASSGFKVPAPFAKASTHCCVASLP